MEVVYHYGRVRLSGAPDQTSWRPAELVDLLMGLRPEPDYVARLLLFRAEDIARHWVERGKPHVPPDEFESTVQAFREWLVLPSDLAPDLDRLFSEEELASPPLQRALEKLRNRFIEAGHAASEGRTLSCPNSRT